MKRLLSKLLWLANSDPPYMCREQFYELKARLLRRYGTPEGIDLQEFPEKLCHTCNGTLTLARGGAA